MEKGRDYMLYGAIRRSDGGLRSQKGRVGLRLPHWDLCGVLPAGAARAKSFDTVDVYTYFNTSGLEDVIARLLKLPSQIFQVHIEQMSAPLSQLPRNHDRADIIPLHQGNHCARNVIEPHNIDRLPARPIDHGAASMDGIFLSLGGLMPAKSTSKLTHE